MSALPTELRKLCVYSIKGENKCLYQPVDVLSPVFSNWEEQKTKKKFKCHLNVKMKNLKIEEKARCTVVTK